jgi:putative zinc- or iron-chelating protein
MTVMPSRAERMEALYAQVPAIPDCKGHCWISCGPASMTPWELKRLADAGHRVTSDEIARKAPGEFWCEALGPDGRCRAYALRPLICRLWGATEWLRCPWGCVPEGGFLPVAESVRLLYESYRVGGLRYPIPDEEFEKLNDPAHVAELAADLSKQGAGDMIRFRLHGAKLPVAITSRPQ